MVKKKKNFQNHAWPVLSSIIHWLLNFIAIRLVIKEKIDSKDVVNLRRCQLETQVKPLYLMNWSMKHHKMVPLQGKNIAAFFAWWCDKNLGRILSGRHEWKCLHSMFWFANVFSSNLNTINLKSFHNHGGIYKFEWNFDEHSGDTS